MSNSNINNIHDLRMYSEHGTEMINDDYISRNTTFSSEKIANDMNNIESSIKNILKNHAGSTNQNILHNWDFTNSINQSGLTKYPGGSNSYTIDRWKRQSSGNDLTVNGDSIELDGGTGGLWLAQPIESVSKYEGKTVTFSAEIISASGGDTVFNNEAIDIRISNSIVKRLTADKAPCIIQVTGVLPKSADVVIQIAARPNSKVKFRRAKLEIGKFSTLAADPMMDYTSMLAICQRFQFPISLSQNRVLARMISYGGGGLNFFIPLHAPMRVAPTIADINNVFAVCPLNSTGEASRYPGFTFGLGGSTQGGVTITALKSGHGLTDGNLISIVATRIMLNANL